MSSVNIAVVAHFHPSGIWDDNFLLLLTLISERVSRAIVITTGSDMPELPAQLGQVRLIRRPNFGYDFYSYRVGIHLALAEKPDGILILNSSITVLERARFRELLNELTRNDVRVSLRGVTESRQFGWHIQSYLLFADLRQLGTSWLLNFFQHVEPADSKFETVLRYEVGFGRHIAASGIPFTLAFQPTFVQIIRASLLCFLLHLKRHNWKLNFFQFPWRVWNELNWTHFGAGAIAQQLGFVKSEFLRSNPHGLDQNEVWEACDPELRSGLRASVEASMPFYAKSSSGLTELRVSAPGNLILKILEGNQYRWANAKVAVVIHLYYLELLEEILDEIQNIIEPADVYITTPFESDIPSILERTLARNCAATIILVSNRGRDVGPFIALYRTGRLDRYDAVLKLHSKKSRYSKEGDHWRRSLYAPLCGSSDVVFRSLEILRRGDCGMLGPAKYFLSHPNFWGANRSLLGNILLACGMRVGPKEPPLAFFAGTMFWFAPASLRAIHHCHSSAIEFEPEENRQDGTLAHAWERALSLLVKDAGYRVSSIELKGEDIFDAETSSNYVPVLSRPGS